jgi:hypothetical protein
MRPEACGSFKAPALNGVWAAVDVLGGSCRAARMPGVNYMSVQHWIANRRRPRPRYVAHLRKLILQLAGELTLIAQRLQAEYTQAERRRQGRLAAFYRRMGEGHGYQGWQGSSPLTEGTTAATVTVMSVMSVKIHRHIFLPSFRT